MLNMSLEVHRYPLHFYLSAKRGEDMKLITVSGPPSSGKTSVILKTIKCLREKYSFGAVKFDCLSSFDSLLYERAGIPTRIGFSGNLCPDHFYITNIEDAVSWGVKCNFDLLITESAGLCNRCSPHIRDVLAICVIDNLSGIHTPRKIGPMLRYADIVIVTKGDIVSQAEREVFSYNIRKANPHATILFVNGITGQGAFMLSRYFLQANEINSLEQYRLRFTMPAALCSYCLGQTKIGKEFEMGNTRKMQF